MRPLRPRPHPARSFGSLSLWPEQPRPRPAGSLGSLSDVFASAGAGATAIGFGLIAPTERLLGRWGGAAVTLLALAGAGLAATAFTFLLVSERTPIFGFMEPGYDPSAIMAARVFELVTVAVLGAFAVARAAAWARRGRR